jgi:hypothetical protein
MYMPCSCNSTGSCCCCYCSHQWGKTSLNCGHKQVCCSFPTLYMSMEPWRNDIYRVNWRTQRKTWSSMVRGLWLTAWAIAQPASHHEGTSMLSGQYMWDLWWTKWHCETVFSFESLSFPVSNILPLLYIQLYGGLTMGLLAATDSLTPS